MVERFCSHGALAIRNSMLVWKLRQLATTDSLTQVANRHTFENTLSIELQRAARGGRSVTLVMIDIDHFKELNDQFGHQAGDQVLRVTAATLRKHCRPFDTLARYGGEEFAVLLPKTMMMGALAVGERMLNRLADHVFEGEARPQRADGSGAAPAAPIRVRVTASFGIATYPSKDIGGADLLIRYADEALYRAKKQRNAICVYQSQPRSLKLRSSRLRQQRGNLLDELRRLPIASLARSSGTSAPGPSS